MWGLLLLMQMSNSCKEHCKWKLVVNMWTYLLWPHSNPFIIHDVIESFPLVNLMHYNHNSILLDYILLAEIAWIVLCCARCQESVVRVIVLTVGSHQSVTQNLISLSATVDCVQLATDSYTWTLNTTNSNTSYF